MDFFSQIIDTDGKERRFSNGPMEGYNRVPKDYKRNSRGLSVFVYTRAILMWANRKNEPIIAIPKSKEEVYKKFSKKKKMIKSRHKKVINTTYDKVIKMAL